MGRMWTIGPLKRDDNPLDVFHTLTIADFWLSMSTRSLPLASDNERRVWDIRWQIQELRAQMEIEMLTACQELLEDSRSEVGTEDDDVSGGL